MNGTLKSLAAALALIAGCIPAAYAQDGCKPVNGRFEASVVLPGTGHCPNIAGLLCTAGRVWGGIQGQYQFVVSGAVPAFTIGGIPTAIFFAGQSTIQLQDGATVVGTDSGTLDLPPGQGGFASLITFDTGASGQIHLRGDFDAAAGKTAGDYLGSICGA
jgi:hypothetical protein